MAVHVSEFDKFEGQTTHEYTITTQSGMSVSLIDFGATITKLLVPSKSGNLTNVVLGYPATANYTQHGIIGGIIGRNGNRIANASFELNGIKYQLVNNDNGNNLHSGPDGFHLRYWTGEVTSDDSVTFSLESPDKDQNYPGNLKLKVTYTLTDADGLTLTYDGVCDSDTLTNMTNHAYFNLEGESSNTAVYDHLVQLNCNYITPVNEFLTPTGEFMKVEGTPFDFRTPCRIGDRIDADHEQIRFGKGIDHNFVVKEAASADIVKAGEVYSEKTGICMEIFTDCVGMQMYTGNFMKPETSPIGNSGFAYAYRGGVCFETQFHPNSVNIPSFPSPVTKAGERYFTKTSYHFCVK